MTTAQDNQRSWKGLWRWPVALGVLAWLIGSNLDGVRQLMTAGVIWQWLAVAAGLRLSAMLLGSARWLQLLHGQDIRLTYSRVLRMFATGYVCNFLLPGTVGGDVARAGMIAAHSPERRLRGAATVPLDRLLGLLAFITVGAIAGLCQWSAIPAGILRLSVSALVVISAVGVTGLFVLLVVRFPVRRATAAMSVASASPNREATSDAAPNSEDEPAPSVETKVQRRRAVGHELLYGLALLRESRRAVLIACLLAALGHSALAMSMYCCLRAFPAADVPAGAVAHLWIVPSAEVPAALLPLPGGVGAREGTLAMLYGGLAATPTDVARYRDVGVVVAATFSTVSLALAILLAAWLTLTGGWPGRPVDA